MRIVKKKIEKELPTFFYFSKKKPSSHLCYLIKTFSRLSYKIKLETVIYKFITHFKYFDNTENLPIIKMEGKWNFD